jgi:biopolymer transport protein ExbD
MTGTDPRPLGEINTTPLIDVMLVLLIMFIIAIPVATNSLDVDLPNCNGPQCGEIEPDILKNRIVIDANDRVLWNGQAVDEGQLVELLLRSRQLAVEPELQFEPVAGASYAATLRTLDLIKAAGVTKFGFVGNERYRRFTAG